MNKSNKMKSIWLSYDLGVRGDYENLYTFLADHRAIDCGSECAYFKTKILRDSVPESVGEEITETVNISKTDRIYIIWREGQKIKGKFIFGKRKAPIWTGYGTHEQTQEEEA